MDDVVDPDAPESGPEPAAAEAPPRSGDSDALQTASARPDASVGKLLRRVGLTLIGVVLIVQAVALARSATTGPTGPWLGEYFEGKEFEGDPQIRYTRKLEFDWGKDRPFRGMPKDKWSAIYTTCLVVEEEAEFRFRLTSDDGSRLFVDDEKLIDNWGPHSPRTRTGKMLFEPGTYELVVEYFEAAHGAELKLVAAIGEDGKHETIPPTMLQQPSDDIDNRCN
ncbi:MAG: PA14 domain-containing protein [Nannocystaceae bacterium]|nr:PA14 domain-containing protein [bacterium]